jgi:predicted metal-binding membrane protein
MIYDERDRVSVRRTVLAITTLAWVLSTWTLSIWTPGLAGTNGHHHTMNRDAVSAGAPVNWLLMLAAMMAPVLIQPIQFVRGSSLARRRTRSTLLFVAGYTALWMFAGTVILPLAAALGSSGLPPYVPAAAVFFVALVWQCSPAKQACLNRCHALRAVAAFGRTADIDVLMFGATQGVWCIGSCWAWMVLPLLLPSGHIAAMAATAVLIGCERLDGPAPIRWEWRGLGRAYRIVAGRVRSGCTSSHPLRPFGAFVKRPYYS